MRATVSLHEDGEGKPTVYDELFQNHPPVLKRFLPAAYMQVRNDPDLAQLEWKDPQQFRYQVSQAAFQMVKMSVSDSSPGISPMASVMGSQPQVQPMREQVDGGRGTSKLTLPHIRIFAVEDGLYILRLGPETYNAITLASLLARLASKGVDPEDAAMWAQTARKEGVVTVIQQLHSPEDISDLDIAIGKGPRPEDQE